MLINSQNLRDLGRGFNLRFQSAFTAVSPLWNQVAMLVPVGTDEEVYGYLKELPGVRQWAGDRVLHNLAAGDFVIKNKKWELSFAVPRDKIETDKLGVYGPLVDEYGRSAAAHVDTLVFYLLRSGFSTFGPDGQYFFDTDHQGWAVTLNDDGTVASVAETSVSNVQAGSGEPWFLLDVSRAIKPVVFQQRKSGQFTWMTSNEDEAVFMRDEYRYGWDGVYNAGFGLWQTAFGSRAPLTAENYEAARIAMHSIKRRDGTTANVTPGLLVHGPGNEGAALDLLVSERTTSGATNRWRGSARNLMAPQLAL